MATDAKETVHTDNKMYHPGLILRLLQNIIGIITTHL